MDQAGATQFHDTKQNNVKIPLSHCKQFLTEEYVTFYNQQLNEDHRNLLAGVRQTFGNATEHPFWPQEIHNLKEFASKLRQFEICVNIIKKADMIHNAGVVLESLRQGRSQGLEENCHEIKDYVKGFVEGGLFKHLATLPKFCEQASDCIADLQKTVGIATSQNESSGGFFSACVEEEKETGNCCTSLETCGSVSEEDKAGYKAHLQNLVNAGNQDVCSSNNAQIRQAHNNLLEETKSACSKVAENCNQQCTEAITDFKKAFLQCFLVPGFQSQYSGYPLGSCPARISEIRKAYRKVNELRGRVKERALDFGSTADEIANCTGPVEEINQNQEHLQARVQNTFMEWCHQAAEEKAKDPNQANSQIVNTNPFDTSYRRRDTYDNSDPNSSSFTGSPGRNPSGGRTNNQDPPPVSGFSDPEGSLISTNLNRGASQQGDEFGDFTMPEAPSSTGPDSDDDNTSDSELSEEEASLKEASLLDDPLKEESTTDSFSDGISYDPVTGECSGICPEGSSGYPLMKKYNEMKMAERRLKEEQEAEAEKEAWEDWKKKDHNSAFDKFTGGVSAGAGRVAGAAKRATRKAYKAVAGEPKPPPPKSLKELIPGLPPPGTSLLRTQLKLIKAFCETNPCNGAYSDDPESKELFDNLDNMDFPF